MLRPRVRHEAEPLEARVVLASLGFTSYSEMYGWEQPHWFLAPPTDLTGWGQTGAGLGDVNADGVPDFVLGAPGVGGEGADLGTPGYVLAYSGATREELYRVGDGFGVFGSTLAAIGDLNDDGVMDWIAGSPFWGKDDFEQPEANQTGRVSAYSGADGSLLWEAEGAAAGDRLGAAIAAMPDVDDDGIDDVAAGAPGADAGVGEVVLLNGADRTEITRVSDSAKRAFGAALDAAEHEGVVYLAVGAPETEALNNDIGTVTAGDVLVYAFEDGGAALHRDMSTFAEHLAAGTSVEISSQGDALVVVAGAPLGHSGRGAVLAANLTNTGSLSYTDTPSDHASGLGSRLFDLQDPNFDNRMDVLAMFDRGAPAPDAYAMSLNPNNIYEVEPVGGPYQSIRLNEYTDIASPTGAVFSAGDMNGDGVTDFIMMTSTELRAISSIAIASPGTKSLRDPPAVRTSPDGRFIWNSPDANHWQYLIADGVFMPSSRVPGLGTSTLVDVNGEGVILAEPSLTVPGTPEPVLLITDGVPTPLSALVSVVDGPEVDVALLRAVALGDGGHVLLSRPALDIGGIPQAWMYHEGVLTYLWEGWLSDVNASGTVLGTALPDGQTLGVAVVWTASHGLRAIEGIYNAASINSSGHVAGVLYGSRRVAVWDGQNIREITTNAAFNTDALPMINDLGQVLVELGDQSYVYDPLFGFAASTSITNSNFWSVLDALDNQGRVHSSGGTFNIEPRALLTALPGEQARIVEGANGVYVISFNTEFERTEFRLTSTGTSATVATYSRPSDADLDDFPAALWVDPKDSLVYALFVTPNQNFLYRESSPGGPLTEVARYTTYLDFADRVPVIQRSLTPFVGADGRVHLAGLAESGELIAFSQTGLTGTNGQWLWDARNLTEEDLAPAGLETPEFVSPLVGYGVAWGGLNIAGVDADGQVWTVWWSPGLSAWTASNLSEIAGAPVLTGSIAPFVAPWNAVHLSGTDSEGHVHVLWWAPPLGAGNWTTNDLTEQFSGVNLRIDTLSTFTTPWNSLNILGLDDEGEVWAYWWTPETNTWLVEPVTSHLPGEAVRPAGKLHSSSSAGGTQNITGVGAEGEVVRLFWFPGIEGGLWQQQNLTELASDRS